MRRTHLAIREWYEQQSALSAQEVDLIRDGSLQELFAIRRGLELAVATNFGTDSKQYRTWIQQLESLHLSLNHLIDSLVPPFATDSLPVALAVYLKKVKSIQTEFEFSIKYASEWGASEPLGASKAILMFFQGLEGCITEDSGISSIDLEFVQTGAEKRLEAKLGSGSAEGARADKKVYDLCRMINFLSAVDCQTLSKEGHLFLTFQWDGREKR